MGRVALYSRDDGVISTRVLNGGVNRLRIGNTLCVFEVQNLSSKMVGKDDNSHEMDP